MKLPHLASFTGCNTTHEVTAGQWPGRHSYLTRIPVGAGSQGRGGEAAAADNRRKLDEAIAGNKCVWAGAARDLVHAVGPGPFEGERATRCQLDVRVPASMLE